MFSNYEQFQPELLNIMMQLESFYMVTHMDHRGAITYTNKEFLTVSQWTPKRVLGKTFWQMFPDTKEAQKQAYQIWGEMLKGKPWSGSTKKMTRSGKPYYVKMTAIPIIRPEGRLFSVLTFEMDMTADFLVKEKLEQAAFYDHETGLMNRHSLETTVNELILNKESFAFVYLSIDHFYPMQDFHSNKSRKEIIYAFTNRMKRYFQNSQIARIGVNEFVILTQFGDWFIEGFNDFLKQHPIHIQSTALSITASGGIIRYPEDQNTYVNMMKASLLAAQNAVELGGEKIISLSTSSHKALNRKSLISQKLLAAIDDKKLQVVYQPQVDRKTGSIVLYEAFVRWEDDQLGTISPDELIPIAEENGLIENIGMFVLTESAELAATLNQAGKPTVISVNTSIREFISPTRNKQIMDVLRESSCPPKLIQLEITEIFAFKAEEKESVFHQMKQLKEEGIEFALDDFGTGYASFRYLQSLPITKLKIDKLFINSLTTHEQTKQLINGMIQFAKSMNLYVIAEGVETEAQEALLHELEIDALQGFFIGEPITKKQVLTNFNL